MNKEFYIRNRQKMIEKMQDNSIGIVFSGQAIPSSADASYPFLVNRNFFYLTGLEEENCTLVITKTKGKIQEELFIEEADPLLEKWVGKRYSKAQGQNISGITKLDWADKFNSRLIALLTEYSYEKMYLDVERTQWDGPAQKGLVFAQEIKGKFPNINIENLYPIIRDLRTLKEAEEVEKIKRAIEITGEGIKSIMNEMRAGVKIFQLKAYFNFAIQYIGARGLAFPTIAAPGEKAVVLHFEEGQDTIEEGELVLFDLGADYGHYCADISRTLPVSGKFTPRQRELYNIVLKAGEEVIKAIKPGLPFAELNNIAKKVLAEECMRIGLIEREEELPQYYYHGVSHYLGLDTHDVGRRDRSLEAGMVITVEPGIYVEEEKIGIRIEDDILVTQEGHEVLSKDIPKTVEEIERFMK